MATEIARLERRAHASLIVWLDQNNNMYRGSRMLERPKVIGGTREAEARLLDRMARARAKHAAAWRVRIFLVPGWLISAGLLISIAIGRDSGGTPIPLSFIVAAAVLSRVLAGLTAGRVAASFAGVLFVYTLASVDISRDLSWVFGSVVSLIAVCLNGPFFPRSKSQSYRSACPPAHEPQTHHIPKQ